MHLRKPYGLWLNTVIPSQCPLVYMLSRFFSLLMFTTKIAIITEYMFQCNIPHWLDALNFCTGVMNCHLWSSPLIFYVPLVLVVYSQLRICISAALCRSLPEAFTLVIFRSSLWSAFSAFSFIRELHFGLLVSLTFSL